MEELLLTEEMAEETVTGECDGGFIWQTQTTSLLLEEENKAGISLAPFRIDLNVSWAPGRGGKKFRLSTIHLARIKEEEDGK